MADVGTRIGNAARTAVDTFRVLSLEQKAAALGALLLIASTFGPFSFVEAAEIVIGLGVLALLRARASGRDFHLPLGDGTAIAAAGAWAGLLIVVRLFDRPLGQNLLALACAAVLFLAGAAERAKHPPEDLVPDPDEPEPESPRPRRRRRTPADPTAEDAARARRRAARRDAAAGTAPAAGSAAAADPTAPASAAGMRRDPGADPLEPPEYAPPGERPEPAAADSAPSGEQLSLDADADAADEDVTRRLPPDRP